MNENTAIEFHDWDGKIHHLSIIQIRKHIPKRLIPHVEEINIDSDGGWVWLKDSAIDTLNESHTIHFYTLKELDNELKEVKII